MGRESALRPRALIVEDEILIALGLKEEMRGWNAPNLHTPCERRETSERSRVIDSGWSTDCHFNLMHSKKAGASPC